MKGSYLAKSIDEDYKREQYMKSKAEYKKRLQEYKEKKEEKKC